MTISGRFQAWMERFARMAGRWWHFAAWLALLCAWLALGPVMRFSDSWQLIANTPTTWYELFLGLALLVDGATQIELLLAHSRRQEELLAEVRRVLDAIAAMERAAQTVETATYQDVEQLLARPPRRSHRRRG
jgi:low affinity Fe/Cu permease